MEGESYIEGLSLLLGSDREVPYLIGGRCGSCNTVVFPKRPICPRCTGQEIEGIPLSRKGKLYTYTQVHHKPPDYRGEVPYFVGRIYLPEGVFVLAQLKAEKGALEIGMDMELLVEPIYQEEDGMKRLGYKFKPASSASTIRG